MNERPLMFSTGMVAQIRANRKTQSRRVVKPDGLRVRLRHTVESEDILKAVGAGGKLDRGVYKARLNPHGAVVGIDANGGELGLKPMEFDFLTPYADGHTYLRDHGRGHKVWTIEVLPEQKLWVRETWEIANDHVAPAYAIRYADGTVRAGLGDTFQRRRSPRFMPRWASRIDLLVTGIRLQRLHHITKKEVLLEGLESESLETFAKTWDKIHSRDGFGWATNPWVFTIDFKLLADRSSHAV